MLLYYVHLTVEGTEIIWWILVSKDKYFTFCFNWQWINIS